MYSMQEAIPLYLSQKRKLTEKSRKTYAFVLGLFVASANNKPVDELAHQDLNSFITRLERDQRAGSTINLAVSAVLGFFKWASFQRIWNGNIADIEYIAEQSKPALVLAAPEYDRKVILQLVEWAEHYAVYKDLLERRDAFLVLAAASTGARLGKELCQLTRGQVDWESGRALVIGKGNKPGKLRFSDIALAAGHAYLQARAEMDGKSGQALTSLPLFSRHRGKKTKALGYPGAYKSLKKRVRALCGIEGQRAFHPHVLRHEFVTRILIETGNLKLAQDLARHTNIQNTQRYAHLAEEDQDRAHKEIFNKAAAL